MEAATTTPRIQERRDGGFPCSALLPGQVVTLINGDSREVLSRLPDESVQCCVTSPPYFGLRDYGVSGQIGLEPTPAEYVANLVTLFREVRHSAARVRSTDWLAGGVSQAL